MIGRNFLAGLIALMLSMSLAASEGQWCMNPDTSWLGFTASWEGQEFQGRFREFDARVDFDPQKLEQSAIEVMVSTPSAGTGNRERDEGMAEPEWFDYAGHPQARYATSAFEVLGTGNYEASGILTLKGISRPVNLRFTWQQVDAAAVLEGQARVSRVDFDIGTGDWADEEFVAHAVTVLFRLELSPCATR